jgi:hypothetical protein
MIELKFNSEGYNKPFNPSVQYLLRPHHQKHLSWEMSLPNSTDELMRLKLAFFVYKKKLNMPQRP